MKWLTALRDYRCWRNGSVCMVLSEHLTFSTLDMQYAKCVTDWWHYGISSLPYTALLTCVTSWC